MVEASGQLKTIAISLFKIANDIRWLSSGPRCGIGEIQLPATQPGSSIMPGKVNPVICESMMMVCARGFPETTTALPGRAPNGNFEAQCHDAGDGLQSSRIDSTACKRHRFALRKRCIRRDHGEPRACCAELVEQSMAMVTSLAPRIGYDRAAEIAKGKRAHR